MRIQVNTFQLYEQQARPMQWRPCLLITQPDMRRKYSAFSCAMDPHMLIYFSRLPICIQALRGQAQLTMQPRKNRPDKRMRFKLPIYIMIAGWLSVAIYVMASLESFGSTEFIEHFLSPDHSGIRFRALILFAPFISTIAGYMVHERERLMRDLEESNKQLEQHLREKDDFITRLGHDIKTPLTPLINLLPIVRKRTTDQSVHGLLDVTIKTANHLKDLVVKTLKHARASQQYSMDDISILPLREVIENSIARHEYAIAEKGVEILVEVPEETLIRCNQPDIEELLGNLLSNAVRFSHEGGHILLNAFTDKEMASVSVRDFGLGLTEEQEERIFEPFYKADESRHELESSGLGLSICKRIVENHGGKIWAESPGQWLGTVVSFTLPTGSKPSQWRQ